MRLDALEKKALKYALSDFKGEVYFFGSRLDDAKRGGDIDILLVPDEKINYLKMTMHIQSRFFSMCEEKLDVIIYNDSLFCREIKKNAKRVNISRI